MDQLLTVENELISIRLTDFLISPDIIKVRNQLIDGTFHIQSIGNSYNVITLKCDVSEAGKTILDNAYIIDKPLRVERDGQYYIGLLQEKPKWSSISIRLNSGSRIYDLQLSIVVSGEGSI